MKGVVIITLCVVCMVVVLARPDEEKYTDQFDGIDIDEILDKDRLFNNYINCLKTGKKCTPDGQTLRDILPDALKTKCAKCTEVQNKQSKKVIRHLIKNKLTVYKDLENMFDPGHEYRKAYADELKAEGIVLPD